ncbi:MAG TPA: glycine--tRNA ligase [Patescibacteria group bacterium]|nr:glycine--tRNA ligase [Patescibacteria group bacterium]
MAENKLEKIVSWAKRRGFMFPSSEIYGGVNGFYDLGPYGVALKNNLKRLWWKRFVEERDDVVGLESSIIMNRKVWQASGHEKGFMDPLMECQNKNCQARFREDLIFVDEIPKTSKEWILWAQNWEDLYFMFHPEGDGYKKNIKLARETLAKSGEVICPKCVISTNYKIKQFNPMFKTNIGVIEDENSKTYLRPETAQGMFCDFKLILETARQKIPFGIAQVGKSFRNEINTKDFLFRVREFEIAEIEYFIKPGEDEAAFDEWLKNWKDFVLSLGIKEENIKEYEHPKEDLSHYSKRTVDLQFNYPFGWKELTGVANRTDFDLKAHEKASGKDLHYFDQESGKKYLPFVIEPTLGIERLMLAVICDAFEETEARTETTKAVTEKETVLHFAPSIAPVKVAILPLVKKLSNKANEIYKDLKMCWPVEFDESGSIGRRYRRQDEIGTPYCVTVDFETEKDKKVTIRNRDTMKQDRVAILELKNYLWDKIGA